MIIENPTALLSVAERQRASLRWTGRLPNGAGIPFGLWWPRQLASAPNRQVACADLVREWEAELRNTPHMARRAEELGIEDGWWAISFYLSCAEQLQIELVLDGAVVL